MQILSFGAVMEAQAADDRLQSQSLNQEDRRELTSKASQGFSNGWAQVNVNPSAYQALRTSRWVAMP